MAKRFKKLLKAKREDLDVKRFISRSALRIRHLSPSIVMMPLNKCLPLFKKQF
ncbi:hypothetical protein ACO3UB_08365 (plasmid) [Methanocaldococcus sp. 16A]